MCTPTPWPGSILALVLPTLYRSNVGVRGYIGITEKKLETTISGLGFRSFGFRASTAFSTA